MNELLVMRIAKHIDFFFFFKEKDLKQVNNGRMGKRVSQN